MNEFTLTNLRLSVDGRLEDGKISVAGNAVERIGSFDGLLGREVDCHGLVALPALVDNHVHFREPGAEEKEDFRSGSSAAAHGGAATVLEVQNSLPLLTTPELIREKKELIARKSKVNVALYASAVPETLEAMEEVSEMTAGLKLFMAPSHADDGVMGEESMRPYFQACTRLGFLLIVHAEDGRLIREAAGRYDGGKPALFSRSRPPTAEIHAVRRALRLAHEYGTRLHVFHVSTAGAVDLISDARAEGADVTASTCPHYLYFTDSDVAERGALFKVFPPIRGEADRRRILEGLKTGVIEIISTDHAPHRPEEKERPFAKVPAGISSSDLLLPLLTTLVDRGHFTLDEIVKLSSANPARIHGLMDAGRIEEGWAANIVLVDLEARWMVSQEDFLSRASLSPYIGMELTGRVAATLVGGQPAYLDGQGPVRGR